MAVSEWTAIVDSPHCAACEALFAVGRPAARSRSEWQPADNAPTVMRENLAPMGRAEIRFVDFWRFFAAFGPAGAVMRKIDALLEVATEGAPWLYFGGSPSTWTGGFALFDCDEPNALVVTNGCSSERIWNLPTVPATEPYVEDGAGRRYPTWREYFAEFPVGRSFHALPVPRRAAGRRPEGRGRRAAGGTGG